MDNKEKEFTFTFSGSFTLKTSEIWPDEIPCDPTSHDVSKHITSEFSRVAEWLEDWNLQDDVKVTITSSDETEIPFRKLR